MTSRRPSLFRFWPLLAIALGSACNDRLISPIEKGGLLATPDSRQGPVADRRESSGPALDLSTDSSALAGSAASLSATAAAGGSPFVVWQNTQTGERAFWGMLGTAYTGNYVSLPRISTPWEIVGTADLSCDGSADIVWQNNQTGERGFWRMTGTSYTGGWGAIGFVSPVWRIAAVADFTGDGKPDLVWENTANGQRGIWPMNCGTYTGQWIALGNAGTVWRIAAAADFTGDGQADLAWFNPSTRQTLIWKMNGSVYSGTQNSVGFITPGWDLVAAGDYTCDGNNDLVWQNTQTGERQVWRMNGSTFAGASWIGNVGTEWDIAATLPTTAACGVPFQIVSPSPSSPSTAADSVGISVRSLHTLVLNQVTASIANYAGRTANLTFTNGLWAGKISLAGLPVGTLHVTVFATDAAGARGGATVSFQNLGAPPVLTVSSIDSALARPVIHLAATCADPYPAGCQRVEARVAGALIASGTTQIDTDVSLAQYEGQLAVVDFTATGSNGRTVTQSRRYYVESSQNLVPIFTVPVGGTFLDIRGDSLLYSAPLGAFGELRLRRIASNSEVVLFHAGAVKGHLYSAGAVISHHSTVCSYANVCHAQVTASGVRDFGGGLNWISAGDFVYWSSDGKSFWFRRDLVGQVTVNWGVCCTSTGGPNGDIVSANADKDILWRFRGYTQTMLGTRKVGWADPMTDGINVVARTPYTNGQQAVWLIDAAGSETILTFDASNPRFLANGFIAFPKTDQFGYTQAYVRSQNGTINQASYFTTNSKLDGLGTDGAVMYVANGKRYLNRTNAVSPPIIGSSLGTAFFRDATPYVLVGRTIFKVVP